MKEEDERDVWLWLLETRQIVRVIDDQDMRRETWKEPLTMTSESLLWISSEAEVTLSRTASLQRLSPEYLFSRGVQIRLQRSVGEIVIHYARSTDPIASIINQNSRCIHEVSISSHIGLLVQPWHGFLQESLQFGISVAVRTIQAKFSDPDGSSCGDSTGGIDIVFKIGSTGILITVPVKVDKVDGTACTVTYEVLEIQQAHRISISATRVGNGRSPNQSFPSKRLHVLLIVVDCCRHIHASTARLAEVGFVKRHERGRAVVDGKLGCGGPLRQKIWVIVVEQRDEL